MPDDPVTIPGQSVDSAAESDILGPLQKLLAGVNVWGDSNDSTGGAFSTPDQAVAIIESGATALTNQSQGERARAERSRTTKGTNMSTSRSANPRFRRFRKGALSSFCRHGEVEEIATRGQAAVRSAADLVDFCRRAALEKAPAGEQDERH